MRFLLDEMYPQSAAQILRDAHGHDALHVAEVGLRGADDSEVADRARRDGRAMVTENVADFAPERDVVLVFVRKRRLPSGSAQGRALAELLDRWAEERPDPYVGPHWPA